MHGLPSSLHEAGSVRGPAQPRRSALTSPTDHQLARTYIERDDCLGPLASKASDLIELRRCFRTAVPDPLASHCEVLNYRRGALVVGAASSAAAAKLRQMTRRLTAVFLEKGWQVSSIEVVIQGAAKR
jgi:hypothetical protein